MGKGIAIELENNFQWNEDSVLVYTTHGCTVIQQGQYEDGVAPFFILLEFHRARCVRSASTDCTPAVGISPENKGVSFIAVLNNSSWDNDAHEKYTYIGTPKRTDRNHYVVSNHDVFHEVLAESFTETKITQTNSDYEKIKTIYLFSKAQLLV